jgi:hypothetical protein
MTTDLLPTSKYFCRSCHLRFPPLNQTRRSSPQGLHQYSFDLDLSPQSCTSTATCYPLGAGMVDNQPVKHVEGGN